MFTKSIFKTGLRFALTLVVLAGILLALPANPAKAYTGYPTFSIVKVEVDSTVTIKTNNLPAGQSFTVRMGKYGTLAIGGEIVATSDSGTGGVKEFTYNIPASLKGQTKIAIRMDSAAGYYAYNWFDNAAFGTGGPVVTPVPGYTGIPTFDISTVVLDTSVTIKAKNFPAGYTFTVRMGKYGTLGVGGEVVGTKDSGAGGAFEATFNIPASLKGEAKIAIRMDSTTGGFYAYNWFTNATTGATGGPVVTPVPGYTGIPTFTINAVVKDDKVTIKTKNFPASQSFTVRMGAYGTMAVGGTVVGTTDSGSGGAFEATYTIPDGLKGSAKIAIRLESTAGYYAYNWFWNNTYP